jgi:tetratricopeptide (TPR) repeat protein
MAISAYEQVEELDQDGHYHLGVLHLVNGDPAAAKREADTILARDPDHLFGLFTAAQAEQGLGRTEEARSFFSRFLERYDAERARNLPEYMEHDRAFPAMLEEARRSAG